MLILKVKLFFAKHKAFGTLLLIVSVFIGLLYLLQFYNGIQSRISDTTKGILGTLLGAIIGGTFTLLGTIWIQQRQAQIQSDFRRSNTIYKPLYDELKEIHDVTLKKNPFPREVFFSRTKLTLCNGVCYEIWSQIKADSRYLEIPKQLKRQMEKLASSAKDYAKEYKTLLTKLNQTISDVNKEYSFPSIYEAGTDLEICQGKSIIDPVLNNKEISLEQAISLAKNYDELAPDLQRKINSYVQELNHKCKDIEQVGVVRENRKLWDKTEDDAITMLACMIQYCNIRNMGW